MRQPVKNLSENAQVHISDTATSRNERNSLLLIYKLVNEFDFHLKTLIIKNDEYTFMYIPEKERSLHESIKSKNLQDFMFEIVDLYHETLDRNPKSIKDYQVTDNERNAFFMVYRLFNEMSLYSKSIHFNHYGWSFSYQRKKGKKREQIDKFKNLSLTEFLLEFVELSINLKKDAQ